LWVFTKDRGEVITGGGDSGDLRNPASRGIFSEFEERVLARKEGDHLGSGTESTSVGFIISSLGKRMTGNLATRR